MSPAFRAIALASNKGGVGKTTIAVNLAVLLRALEPETPVLVVGLDDQDVIDRMFASADAPARQTLSDALRSGDLTGAIRAGRFGVHYIPTPPSASELRAALPRPDRLAEVLAASGWTGRVVIDTKSDLDVVTQNAIWASDLAVLPVTDQSSLLEAAKVFDLLERWGRSREHGRVVLSMVDLRIKYADAEHGDVLALLLAEIRARGWPLFESFLSRSPRVEALNTNTGGRPQPISENAQGSLVNAQLRHLAEELLRALAALDASPPRERRQASRRSYAGPLVAFPEQGADLIELRARDLSRSGLGADAAAPLAAGQRLHVALRRDDGRPLLLWARVVRASPPAALAFEGLREEATSALEGLLAR